MYTSACIEEATIGRTLSNIDSKEISHINSWNDYDHALNYQLDQWGVDKLFQNSDKVIIRELNLYIEDRKKLNIMNNSQLSSTTFLAKYGSLDLYDEDRDKIFIIDHEQLQYNKMLYGL